MSRARISDIVALASEMTVIAPSVILGRSRYRRVARVRQACMAVAREAGHSYCNIGRRMNRDHSTIVYGVEKACSIAEGDENYASFLNRLRNAAKTAKPLVSERARRLPQVILPPKPAPEPEPEPVIEDLSGLADDELLSRAVAAHYAGASA